MAVLVPIDRDSDGEEDIATAVPDPDPAPAPAPMELDGDGDGDRAALVPAPMDRDGDGDGAALVPSTGDGRGSDYLSDLPEDILACILARLRDTHAAATTSVLSRRWHHVWTCVSSLFLHHNQPHDSRPVRVALAAHGERGATNIRLLCVVSLHSATPDATASWLRVAAPLISGELRFRNRSSVPSQMLDKELFNEIIEERGAFELPCFTRATKILLDLGFLGLSLPPSGVFPTLRELHLVHVQFHGEFTLDDTMMPFLEGLGIYSARGLASLTLRLKRLIWMNLFRMRGLLWLNAVVPGLKALSVCYCFRSSSRQIGLAGVCIVAEELVVLKWIDWYCPICVNFNQMPRLQMLSVSPFYPFGRHNMFNPSCDWLLKLFPRIHGLQMLVCIEPHLGCVKPLKEGVTGLPDIRILYLQLITHGHAYGASVLQILTMCTGITKLKIEGRSEVQYACPPNCICDRPPNWRDEDISLEALREVEILNFRGKKPELDLLRVLVRVAPNLRRIKITCHRSFAAWETLSASVRSFARQVTSVQVSQATPSLQPQLTEVARALLTTDP